MDAHAEGDLATDELRELETLVAAVDDLNFANTRRLVEHRSQVRAAIRMREHSAAD